MEDGIHAIWITLESDSSVWLTLFPVFVSLVIGLLTIRVLWLTLQKMEEVRKLSHEPNLLVQSGSFELIVNFDDQSANWLQIHFIEKPRLVNAGGGAATSIRCRLTLDYKSLDNKIKELSNRNGLTLSRVTDAPWVKVEHKDAHQFAIMKVSEEKEVVRESYLPPETISKSDLYIDMGDQPADSVLQYIAYDGVDPPSEATSFSSSRLEITYGSNGEMNRNVFGFTIQLISISVPEETSNARNLLFNIHFQNR